MYNSYTPVMDAIKDIWFFEMFGFLSQYDYTYTEDPCTD